MRVAQEKVRAFHDKQSYPTADRPTAITPALAAERLRFIREELTELGDALEAHDLVKTADGLADLLYVVLGTAVVCGIDVQPIFDEVHRSNMTKTPFDPVTHKGGKGAGYEPPRIAELLILQTFGDLDAKMQAR